MIKKAMIFAAGKGTRLKPITESIPKALVEFQSKPLLEIVITKLIASGIKEFVINVHHFSDQIVDFVTGKKDFGAKIVFSDESDLLLDTGGGLKKAAAYFEGNEPFLLHNVDIISDIDINLMHSYHLEKNALATIAVSSRETQRYFLFDDRMTLRGWKNIRTGEIKGYSEDTLSLKRLAFSGIHILDPRILGLMPQKDVFSMVELYLLLMGNQRICGYVHSPENWRDLGKIEDFVK